MRDDFEYKAGRYIVRFPQMGIEIWAERLRENRDGDIICDLKVRGEVGGEEGRIFTGKANLSSPRSRIELCRALNERYGEVSLGWATVLETMVTKILSHYRQGSPPSFLSERDSKVSFILEPFILEGEFNLLYGPGGGLKSYIALYLSIIIQNGLSLWGQEVKGRTVLYLDWETSQKEMERRFTLLKRGLEAEKVLSPYYRRCERPITSDAYQLSKIISDIDPKLVVIDSAWGACGGNIKDEQVVLPFFSTLRELLGENGTALILTHVTKEERRGSRSELLPIGSIYFENIPRTTWLVKTVSRGPEVVAMLYHRKTNTSMLFPPLGMVFSFFDDRIEVFKTAPLEEEKTESLSGSVLNFLKEGPKRPKEITEFLEENPNTINAILNYLERKGMARKIQRGLWSLTKQPEEEKLSHCSICGEPMYGPEKICSICQLEAKTKK